MQFTEMLACGFVHRAVFFFLQVSQTMGRELRLFWDHVKEPYPDVMNGSAPRDAKQVLWLSTVVGD
jgi:hypothetical protein